MHGADGIQIQAFPEIAPFPPATFLHNNSYTIRELGYLQQSGALCNSGLFPWLACKAVEQAVCQGVRKIGSFVCTSSTLLAMPIEELRLMRETRSQSRRRRYLNIASK